MGRRLLSHFLIMLAVFMLSATFFMWTIDNRVLNADVLSGELRKSGVSQELATLLPQIVTSSAGDIPAEDKILIQGKIAKVINAEYIDSKIYAISDSLLTFMRNGEPEPKIDISDFPALLQAAGGDFGAGFEEKFPDSIALNENGELNKITNAYSIFNKVKYAGAVLFVLIMAAEWFVAERGQKLRRVSRVFLYSGFWYIGYWLSLIVIPSMLSEKIVNKIAGAEFDPTKLIDAVLKAVVGLFSSYFLGFAIICLVIALILYIIRHLKHGDVMSSQNPDSSTPKTKSKK